MIPEDHSGSLSAVNTWPPGARIPEYYEAIYGGKYVILPLPPPKEPFKNKLMRVLNWFIGLGIKLKILREK